MTDLAEAKPRNRLTEKRTPEQTASLDTPDNSRRESSVFVEDSSPIQPFPTGALSPIDEYPTDVLILINEHPTEIPTPIQETSNVRESTETLHLDDASQTRVKEAHQRRSISTDDVAQRIEDAEPVSQANDRSKSFCTISLEPPPSVSRGWMPRSNALSFQHGPTEGPSQASLEQTSAIDFGYRHRVSLDARDRHGSHQFSNPFESRRGSGRQTLSQFQFPWNSDGTEDHDEDALETDDEKSLHNEEARDSVSEILTDSASSASIRRPSGALSYREPLSKSAYDSHKRRASLLDISPPERAAVVEDGRIVFQRSRANSVPTLLKMPSRTDSEALQAPEVRNVIFTMSPHQRDARFRTGSQPLAMFMGERLLEAHGDTEDLHRLSRAESRASIRSLEKWHLKKMKRHRKPRSRAAQLVFEYTGYLLMACSVYFVLVGRPLWKGLVWYMWYLIAHVLVITAGASIFVGVAFLYAVGALLVRYEPDPSPIGPDEFQAHLERGSKTALIIPCYKSAEMIGATVEAALKVFPPENIYVVANGNSPTPLDNTEEVIRPYKVNHIWVPIGSKIVAQFVGTYAAYKFQYVLMIDDDCLLPPAFPIVSSRIQPGTKAGLVKCVGYTIKATGPNSSKGTVVQQLQDLEYKLSGMQRKFASTWGSATFAHGAIALWERDFILKCFRHHPGFKISEDWYFGLVCRNLGGRVVMCTSVLVETEVPSGLFVGAGARGGFGEMTVYKQRFYRWNFLFLYRLWNNIDHILFKWDLGVYSIGSKVYTFQEVWNVFLYLTTPFFLPLAFIVRPSFAGIMTGAVIGMYFAIVTIFNETVLRKKKEMVSRKIVFFYYIPYKFALRLMNVASVYYAMWKYAKYFSQRHPSILEDEDAVELVIHSKRPKSDRGLPEPAPRPLPATTGFGTDTDTGLSPIMAPVPEVVDEKRKPRKLVKKSGRPKHKIAPPVDDELLLPVAI